jgi:hypothetical protein
VSAQDGLRPPGAGATVALVLAFCLLFLGGIAILVFSTDHPFSYFSRDPAIELGASPLVGVLSHAGVLLAWGAATVCAFAGALVARARDLRHAAPLLLAALGTAYLALDDLFLFHDDIYPQELGLDQDLVIVLYAVAAIAYLAAYRDFFREHEWPLLALALAALGASLLLDLVNVVYTSRIERWLEESSKFVGLALLAAYLVRLSTHMLLEAYAVVSRRDAPVEAAAPVDAPVS